MDLHIDPATRNLILNLIRCIRSAIPVDLPPESALPDDRCRIRNQDEIRDILLMSQAYLKELEGIFNVEELRRYSRYASDYQEILHHIEKLYEETKRVRDYAIKFSGILAGMVEDHLKLAIPPAEASGKKGSTGDLRMRPQGIKLKIV